MNPGGPNPGAALVEAAPLAPGVRVQIARTPVPPDAPAGTPVHDRWETLRRENPRLYNAGVLSVVSVDFERGEILCRRDTYQRLVVQPQVRTGVRQLSVTGVLSAPDRTGRLHVLLGRRGAGTRIYPGLWELGPSGGVPSPSPSIESLDARSLAACLYDEIAEEIGVDLHQTVACAGVCALVRDHIASSDDVILRLDLAGHLDPGVPLPPANWEYEETRWVPVDELTSLDQAGDLAIIEASRALMRLLGWL